MKKQEVIDRYYHMVYCGHTIDGADVSIYKPIDMMTLKPAIVNRIRYCSFTNMPNIVSSSKNWNSNNIDNGNFDAMLVACVSQKRVEIYICSLLCRPFSDDAQKVYESLFDLSLLDRLNTRFDSRVYDLVNNTKITMLEFE